MASEGSPKASVESTEPSKDAKEWESAPVKEEKKTGKGKGNLDASGRSRTGDGKGQHRGTGTEAFRDKGGKAQSGATKSSAPIQKQPVASASHADYFRDKFDTGMRRQHDVPAIPKHGDEFRLQQAKRTAWVRAQTAGATGNYRNCDSQFGNYLIPVIPNQFFNKSPTSNPTSPVSAGFNAPSVAGNVGKNFS